MNDEMHKYMSCESDLVRGIMDCDKVSENAFKSMTKSIHTMEEEGVFMRSAEQYGNRAGTILPGDVKTSAEVDEPGGVRPVCVI